MAASILDTVSTHLEVVADDLKKYYVYDTGLIKRIGTPKVVKASRYLYRIPFQTTIGGHMKKVSANRGDMGPGTGPDTSHLTGGYFYSTYNFEFTDEQLDVAQSSRTAMIDLLGETMGNVMMAMLSHDNMDLLGSGTGALTNAASSSPAANALTFAVATDGIQANRLFPGRAVDVWDTTGATKRAGGPYYIDTVDYDTGAATTTANITGVAATDKFAVHDADAYGPATLTSFSSTWPGGGLTNAPGLTGDSWRHGLDYYNDTTDANYILGRQKSAVPQIKPSAHNAASGTITWAMGEKVKNKIKQRFDETVLQGATWVMHFAQLEALKNTLTYISTFERGTGNNRMIDLQPQGGDLDDTFNFAGLPAFVCRAADKSKSLLFNPNNWCRVESKAAGWRTAPDSGSKFFTARSTSTANPLAAWVCYMTQGFDWANEVPGVGGTIHTLAF